MMRERTLTRKVIEALPDMKLSITTGARNASIDMKACAERGVTVCGTGTFGSPTAGIAIGLMLELTRRIGFENARLKAGAPWQIDLGPGPGRPHAWHPWPGQARPARGRRRQSAGHEGHRLEPKPDARKGEGGGRQYVSKENLFSKADIVTIHVVLSDRSKDWSARKNSA